MAITGSPMTPTAAANALAERWAGDIDLAPYARGTLVNLFTDKGELMNQFHQPKHGAFTPAAVAAGDDQSGHGLSFQENYEAEAAMTPSGADVNVSINDNTLLRMMADPTNAFRTAVEDALVEKIDQDLATLFGALATNPVGAYGTAIALSSFLEAKSAVMEGAKVGPEENMWFAYRSTRDQDVMTVAQFTESRMTGQGTPATVSGRIQRGYNVEFYPTTAIHNAGTGYDNCLSIKRAFIMGFNTKPRVKLEVQRFGRATWILAYTEHGYATLRDAFAALLKS